MNRTPGRLSKKRKIYRTHDALNKRYSSNNPDFGMVVSLAYILEQNKRYDEMFYKIRELKKFRGKI